MYDFGKTKGSTFTLMSELAALSGFCAPTDNSSHPCENVIVSNEPES